MRLTPEDQTWLEAYRQALAQQFPALVQHLILFGSKARGTATADSDLDLLVVIQQGDWRLKDAVAEVGYLLAIGTDVVPSIIVLTVEEWGRLQKREAPFWQTVTRDGVAEFQAVDREKYPTPDIARWSPAPLTRVSTDAGCPLRRPA